jgi:RNase P subunit RPR2
MYNYKTYYPIDKEIVCFFYLSEYDCYQLDDDIKIEFDNLRIKSTGGIEYYKLIDSADIEKYLIKRNIKYEKYFYVENLIVTSEQIINVHKKIAQEYIEYSNYLEKKITKPNLRDEIQEQYIKECEKELIDKSRVFIKAPTGFGKTHIFYKLIKKMDLKKVLFLTPRILLNQ